MIHDLIENIAKYKSIIPKDVMEIDWPFIIHQEKNQIL